jgi:mRNA interferase MazF
MKRGDIYLCDLGASTGHVQSGLRPVLVVQNDKGNQHSPTVIVCGITSSPKKIQPTHCFISTDGGLPKPSTALCEQIFTVNTAELKHYIGTVSNPYTLQKLDTCLQVSLGLNQGTYYERQRPNYNYKPRYPYNDKPFRRV